MSVFAYRRSPWASGALLSYDGFNRANGAVGSTNGTGLLDPLPWTTQQGTMAVASNRLVGTATVATVTCNLGTPNVDISLTLSAVDVSGIGIMCRFLDLSNYIYYNGNFNNLWQLTTRVAGAPGPAILQNIGLINSAGGSVVRLVANGDNFFCWIDGVLKGTGSSTFNNTVTTHGIREQSTSQQVDDWTVRVP